MRSNERGADSRTRPRAARGRNYRPLLESLEDRSVPSTFTAASVNDLIADITAANKAGGSNTITLAPGTTFTLTEAKDTTDGATGLPAIAAGDNLTIIGNGDTIARKASAAFRLLDVTAGGSLTLQDLTLQGGLAPLATLPLDGTYSSFYFGGAILNRGTLTLTNVVVQNNSAQGGNISGLAEGGGIFSDGTLTLDRCTIRNNQAIGGSGGTEWIRSGPGAGRYPYDGGPGLGGGLYVAGGTVTLRDSSVTGNNAKGGKSGGSGSRDGTAGGGGLYVAKGTISLIGTTVTANSAQSGYYGIGGGLYISPDTPVSASWDAYTRDHVKKNTASTSGDDVFGRAPTLIP